MKSFFYFTCLMLSFCLIAVSCNNSTPGEAAKTEEAKETASAPAAAQTFVVDAASSGITWTGGKPTGATHTGTIKITSGEFAVENGEVASGTMVIDMNSIENTDLTPEDGKEKLEGHLKSEDFFDVAKFPTATFAISSIEKVSDNPNVTHRITGNLTMKGATKSITFDSNVAVLDNQLTAVSPSFTINRTEWGVNHKSGILGTIKDQLINDDIALNINLKAVPQ